MQPPHDPYGQQGPYGPPGPYYGPQGHPAQYGGYPPRPPRRSPRMIGGLLFAGGSGLFVLNLFATYILNIWFPWMALVSPSAATVGFLMLVFGGPRHPTTGEQRWWWYTLLALAIAFGLLVSLVVIFLNG